MARLSKNRSRIRGRMPGVRLKAAPLGATMTFCPSAGSEMCDAGSILKVRMMEGYRLLKSRTSIWRAVPACGDRIRPPGAELPPRRSTSRVGATRPRSCSSLRAMGCRLTSSCAQSVGLSHLLREYRARHVLAGRPNEQHSRAHVETLWPTPDRRIVVDQNV